MTENALQKPKIGCQFLNFIAISMGYTKTMLGVVEIFGNRYDHCAEGALRQRSCNLDKRGCMKLVARRALNLARSLASAVASICTIFGLVVVAAYCAAAHEQLSARLYAGSQACAGCHAAETAAWKGSHHAAAMAVATKDSVQGDFSGAVIESRGSTGRFFQYGNRFVVETEGRDGQTGRFEVSHTFGVEPLQQYLVTFPDGRLQALPWTWDTRPKEAGGQRWLHLYPDRPMPSSDPLHWTRSMQNWNFMCAECHTTGLHKNYDAAKDRFNTSFSETGVGCESCHGPGSGHVAWANGGRDAGVAHKGFVSVHARREHVDWSPAPTIGSPAQAAARPIGDEVELCGHCHSRRGQISEDWRPGRPLTDTHMPALLAQELFEDDGQIKDEVFNDHSFKQSLMYAKGVTCGDCHDPHSGKPEGRALGGLLAMPSSGPLFIRSAFGTSERAEGAGLCLMPHAFSHLYGCRRTP